jgi:hypothetical protein
LKMFGNCLVRINRGLFAVRTSKFSKKLFPFPPVTAKLISDYFDNRASFLMDNGVFKSIK